MPTTTNQSGHFHAVRFYGSKDAQQRTEVCRQHTHLLMDDEQAQPITAIN